MTIKQFKEVNYKNLVQIQDDRGDVLFTGINEDILENLNELEILFFTPYTDSNIFFSEDDIDKARLNGRLLSEVGYLSIIVEGD